jgi:hypothetical protein
MQVSLPGGYIETTGTYQTHEGTKNTWRATSSWTGQSIECLSRGLAEFFVWIINERCASEVERGVREPA